MPKAALKPCSKSGCIELVTKGYCAAHQELAKQHDKWRGSAASRGYGSTWQRVRVQALKRDHYLCQHCLKAGRVQVAIDVDHITPISVAPHRRLDLTNLQSLCRQCHRIKTVAEKSR